MKHAIITGGATSIGFETAKQLVSQGVSVTLIDINETALTKAFVVLGNMVDTYIADVSKSSDVERVISEIVKKHPNISYIVNTPVANPHIPFCELTMNQIQEVVDLTLTSYAYTIKACWDFLEKGSSIVNISSVHGFTTYKGNSMYAASKAGVESLTRALAGELRDKQVRINVVAPGGFTSEYYKENYPDWKEKLDRGQIFTTEDMTNIVMFLLDGKSRAINGETIIADGGVFTVRSSSSNW